MVWYRHQLLKFWQLLRLFQDSDAGFLNPDPDYVPTAAVCSVTSARWQHRCLRRFVTASTVCIYSCTYRVLLVTLLCVKYRCSFIDVTASVFSNIGYAANSMTFLVMQGDHLSGKQRNVRDFNQNQGNVKKKILSGKTVQKIP